MTISFMGVTCSVTPHQNGSSTWTVSAGTHSVTAQVGPPLPGGVRSMGVSFQ